eukprot:TRINITY_DN1308_c0_g1_i5.p1 TRINITY_DN1308_c0_g1~~TRINITY_DN1308_c0_g1_i5.p1  ORF type:complete len:239 (-),score=62.04 TRINITY_DN1308_c0_g1_i5:110-826(-)
MIAAMKGYKECVRVLLDNARPGYATMVIQDGWTAATIAEHSGHSDIANMISEWSGGQSFDNEEYKERAFLQKLDQIQKKNYEEGVEGIMGIISTCSVEMRKRILETMENKFEDFIRHCHTAAANNKPNIAITLANIGLFLFCEEKEVYVFHIIKGKMNRRLRNLRYAIQDCNNAIELGPKCADAFFEMGMSLKLQNSTADAIQAFAKCLYANRDHKLGLVAFKDFGRVEYEKTCRLVF